MNTDILKRAAVVTSLFVVLTMSASVFAHTKRYRMHHSRTHHSQSANKSATKSETKMENKPKKVEEPEAIINPIVTHQIFDKAKDNINWKSAFVTGKQAQIVFMNISPQTDKNNETGLTTHAFDQVIFIADGNGKAILDSKVTIVNTGDMIFIPQGTPYNIINMDPKSPLKLMSIYTKKDIPADSTFKMNHELTAVLN